jgi:L-asparaginase
MTDRLAYTFYPQAEANEESSTASAEDSVLLIYTGGTIGAVPSDRSDPMSPLIVAEWEEFDKGVPQLDELRASGVRIDAVALNMPLDSTNIEPCYWSLFVEIIDRYYDEYMGFVLLHGTDTMVFTASALSFMLSGLDKPVIITGSQIPILDHPHTDGTRNLVNALRVAAYRKTNLPKVGEVCIAFDDVLLRGNRARKVSADTMKGFDSPNIPPLGSLGDPIAINTELLRQPASGTFNPQSTLDASVISVQIFPGIQNGDVLRSLLGTEQLRGAVLQAYGAGNGPTAVGFLDPIADAVDAGKIVVDVTQCTSGSVRLGQYETGVGLMTRGVLSGSDMTPEAALCKLMVLLGRAEMAGSVAQFMQQSRAGEQSESLYTSIFDCSESDGWTTVDGGSRLDLTPSSYDTGWEREKRIASSWLHLHDAAIEAAGPIECEVYFQSDSGGRLQQRGFAARVKKDAMAVPGLVSIDVSDGMAAVEPRLPPGVTLFIKGAGVLRFDTATLVVVVDDRTQR